MAETPLPKSTTILFVQLLIGGHLRNATMVHAAGVVLLSSICSAQSEVSYSFYNPSPAHYLKKSSPSRSESAISTPSWFFSADLFPPQNLQQILMEIPRKAKPEITVCCQ
ncbi:hypothetical protein ACFX12_029609 [Malus domestica]